jgi:hypothetical protein
MIEPNWGGPAAVDLYASCCDLVDGVLAKEISPEDASRRLRELKKRLIAERSKLLGHN